MNPTGLVSEDDAAIADRRGSPEGPARLKLPNYFAFIRRQAIEVTIAGPNIDLSVGVNWTGPDADVFARVAEMSTISHKIPNQLAAVGFIATHDAVLGSSVNKAIY